MKRRLLVIMAFLCLTVGLLPTTALATNGTAWTDIVSEQPAGYTVDNAGNVTISSPEGLAWLARQVNNSKLSFSGKTITLANAIDLSTHEWVPIGTQTRPFDGTFDGGNYEISGMSITVSERNTIAGLFGYVGASTIQNVVIQHGQIAGTVTASSDLVINLGGLAGANVDQTNVTIENCTIDTAITLTTTGSVETNIGGVIGYVDDYSNTYAAIHDTNAVLSVDYTSTDTDNTTNIGGIVGDIHSYRNTSFIESGDVGLSVSITGSADSWSTLYHIGGVVGYMPTHGSSATGTVVSLQNMTVDTELDFTSSSGILIDAIFSAPAEIGGFFGRGFRYQVTDCFAKTLLRGPDGETPSHYGNLAGYTYNDEISCERVYTYAARYEGNAHFENERLSKDNSNMPNYPLKDVYYIEPQELTEGVEGAPFLYKTFHDSHQVTAGINDGFVYRDGDSSDSIIVTPSTDGKTVAITPANERCAVGGHLNLSSGFEVDFVLPVPVYPEGGGTYDITCEAEDLGSSGWTSCKVTTEPVEKAKAGDQVTITASPVPSSIKLVDSVTVTDEDGALVNVTKTEGNVTGNQTYTFKMPASNVTVTGVFRKISTEFTLTPDTVTFEVYEGYTAEDVESQTVTITNTGDKDVTFSGKRSLPTRTYYDIQPKEGDWGGSDGREIKIAPGGTAAFTVAPKPGLTSASNPNSDTLTLYCLETTSASARLRMECTVTKAPVYTLTAAPDALSFGRLYEGYTAPSGQTVTLTNTGTGTLNVTLPTSEHFTITPDASWINGTASLAPNNSATVTVTPRQGLTAGTYQDTICFATDQAGIEADVTASFSVSPGGTVIPPAATHTITATAGSGGSISPSGEVAVTEGTDQAFTITPDEGNKVRDVAIDGKSVGALGSYTFEDVRGDLTISITFTRGNAPADPDDTGVSDWFETGDHDAFMHGYDDGTGRFGPDDNMTRGEAAQMFYNMLKDKSRGDVQFDFEDLSEGAWYYEAVATMASHGILLGTSPTTVEPERPITRAEFTAMAMRFSKGDLSGENIFTDVFEGDWYYGVIVGSIKYGWISGYDDGTGRFGPNDNITRAQATIIANRMLGRVPDGVYINAHLDELTRFPDVSEGFYAFRDIVEATNSHDYSKDGGFEHWSALR